MSGKFLNLDQDASQIGAGLSKLKKTKKPKRIERDKEAVAKAGEKHGFTRSTGDVSDVPRRGRPPLNEKMTYWRIYLRQELRDELNALRDSEQRRLSDLLEDMLIHYKVSKSLEKGD